MPPRIPSISTRDPVCQDIERFLHELDARGLGRFKIEKRKGCIRVTYAGLAAEGMSLDMALVRLAVAMLNDVRSTPTLMALLAVEMRVSQKLISWESN